MSSRSELPRPTVAALGLLLILLSFPLGCADGPSPAELDTRPGTASLALNPRFTEGPAKQSALPVTLIRAMATAAETGEEVGRTEETVDPDASSWDVELEVEIPSGISPVVIVTLELINVGDGTETVVWSGRVGPLTLTPGATSTVADLDLVRGPLDNLSVTAVTIQEAPARMREGDSAPLSATVDATDSQASPRVFWASLDEDVATVAATGSRGRTATVQALRPGTARIVATSGPEADTVEIQVLPALEAVTISPTQAVATALGQTLQFTARVLDEAGNPASGEPVTWTVGSAAVLRNDGDGTVTTLATGTSTVTVTSVNAPTLSATATVTVTQDVSSAEVTPAQAALTALGAQTPFTATALDANGNDIPGANFLWSSSDEEVATVDGDGLATALSNGTVTITAEVEAGESAALGGGSEGPARNGTGITATAQLTVDQVAASVDVLPQEGVVAVGQTIRFFATARDANGYEIAGAGFTWTSANPTVATVDAQGVAIGVAEGGTTITAETPGASGNPVSDSADLTVTAEADWIPADFHPLGVGLSWAYDIVEYYGGQTYEFAAQDEITGMVDVQGETWYRRCGDGFTLWSETTCDLMRNTAEAVWAWGDEGTQAQVPLLRTPLEVGTTWELVENGVVTNVFTIVEILDEHVVDGSPMQDVIKVEVLEGQDFRADLYFARGIGLVQLDQWDLTDSGWELVSTMTLSSNPGNLRLDARSRDAGGDGDDGSAVSLLGRFSTGAGGS
jgi:uncharacterized protein YjdB